MGDIAEMMLDGTLCEGCGSYIDSPSSGIPRRCGTCQPTQGRQKQADPALKAKCPTCGKRVKLLGLSDHISDAHKEQP